MKRTWGGLDLTPGVAGRHVSISGALPAVERFGIRLASRVDRPMQIARHPNGTATLMLLVRPDRRGYKDLHGQVARAGLGLHTFYAPIPAPAFRFADVTCVAPPCLIPGDRFGKRADSSEGVRLWYACGDTMWGDLCNVYGDADRLFYQTATAGITYLRWPESLAAGLRKHLLRRGSFLLLVERPPHAHQTPTRQAQAQGAGAPRDDR